MPSGTESVAIKLALAPDNQVNINKSDDPFYRYKCPQLVATCANANASKMVKTSLCNVEDVARSLQRPPSYVVNYIGYRWSTKCEYKPGQKSYVSGYHTAEDLDEVLSQFVQEWVLCPQCKSPELNLEIVALGKKRGSTVLLTCSACGYSGNQKPEIMAALPKMTAHILNNPPAANTATQQIEVKRLPLDDATTEAKQPPSESDAVKAAQAAAADGDGAQIERQLKISRFYDEDDSQDESDESDDETDSDDGENDSDTNDGGSELDGDMKPKHTDTACLPETQPEPEPELDPEPEVLVFGQPMSAKHLLQRLVAASDNETDTFSDLPVEVSHSCARLAELTASAELTALELQLIAGRFGCGAKRRKAADFGLFLTREVGDGPGISAMRSAARKRLHSKQQEEQQEEGKGEAAAKRSRDPASRSDVHAALAAVAEMGSERGQPGVVHLRIQMRNGRKSITTVSNLMLPPTTNLKAVKKELKTHCRCAVSVTTDEEFGEMLQLQGDHRAAVEAFLLAKNLVDRDHLMIHGW